MNNRVFAGAASDDMPMSRTADSSEVWPTGTRPCSEIIDGHKAPGRRRCASTLTRFEVFLLCAIGLLIGFLLTLSVFWLLLNDNAFGHGSVTDNAAFNVDSLTFDSSATHSRNLVCTSKECTRVAALFISNMNDKVDPCTDFYEFACGNYATTRDLGAGKPIRHTIIDTQQVLNKQIKQVLEMDVTDKDRPWDRLTKMYYAKCVDEKRVNADGKAAILALLGRIGGWPVLEEDSWREFPESTELFVARTLNQTSVSSIFFEVTVSNDPKNSSRTVIELDQPKFGIGSRWPYLSGMADPMVINYTHLIVETAVRLGANRVRAEREMREAVELETRLVAFSAEEADRGDPDRGNNPFVLHRLTREFPGIDLPAFLKAIFNETNAVEDNDTVIIREVAYFRGIQINEMTNYFKKTFVKQLAHLDWMDEKSKETAIRKAHMIRYKSGFPPEIFNDTWMTANWKMPPTTAKEGALDLTLRVKRRRASEEIMKYKKPVDRSFWYQSPAQVDAFYAPTLNEMIFPAGIMQYPFLASNVPNYVTFAMIGAVISHELTHAFCSQGSRYDEYGNLNDWWDAETASKYFDKADCFVRQYEEERPKELGGQRLNGRLSLGENIADNGGVKTAFRAYTSWKAEHSGPEPSLPGLQNFTSDQIFFVAYANNWCSMAHPQYAGQLLTGDVHAPARLRAVVPLRNRPEFARVFNCPLNSPMNPRRKCSLW